MFGVLSHLGSVLRAPPVKRVLIVNGHPDSGAGRYCAALCAAYAEGAGSSGYLTQRLDTGAITRRGSWNETVLEQLWRADRVFIVFPMWLGGPPPALRFVLDEFARWHDAVHLDEPVRDAHVVVTASLPGLVYRTNGGDPVGEWATPIAGRRIAQAILIGSVETMTRQGRSRWLRTIRHLGASPLGSVAGKAVLGCSR